MGYFSFLTCYVGRSRSRMGGKYDEICKRGKIRMEVSCTATAETRLSARTLQIAGQCDMRHQQYDVRILVIKLNIK